MDLADSFKIQKSHGAKFAWLTAYDYPSARLLDEVGIDLILVGDSLGMVVLGYKDTVDVTMEEMIHHLKAVRRGVRHSLVAADLPSDTYRTPEEALFNANRLIDAGANAVKLEGFFPEQIELLTKHKIEVIGHLGMLPQQVRKEGGYNMKGKTDEEANKLINSALSLQNAGCCSIVLELVHHNISDIITRKLDIPTIGIGSGGLCDGQILVLTDLLGMQPWFRPSFVKPKADMGSLVQQAVKAYIAETKG